MLATNEEKEWVMSERCVLALLLVREKRVLPFPNLPRKDNDGKNKATKECRLRLVNKALFDLRTLCRALWSFRATKGHKRKTLIKCK